MAPKKIFDANLVTTNIEPKEETYYLITKESLGNIKEKSIVADILMLISSLLFGAFFSVVIALGAATSMTEETKVALEIYKWVFLGFGVLFFVFTVVTVLLSNKLIASLTSQDVQIAQKDDETAA
ncbi:MAG: hypothetical protein JJ936_15015 [Psychroserpens sp.]|nr:hypothetical protein [Psychroserpens sp.]